MNKIENHKKNWEALGESDPFWAVLSDNSKRFNNWDVDEFIKTGEAEVENVFSQMKSLGIGISRGEILDFGCGVGRLARHWLKYFDKYNGTDISEAMIKKAQDINKGWEVEFFVNNDSLEIFDDNKFDFIYSGIVLQHLPDKDFIKKYILEFKRILKPGGGLVFQLPSKIPWTFRLQPVRRLYNFLSKIGFSEKFLYQQLGLYPIKMSFILENDMRKFLEDNDFKVLSIKGDTYCGPRVESRTYYCQK
ncbi:MAG TPA: class I SAM-dependent methyltransferase [bacterium]|nr:class I SAM-dependent methyltransferase [bacterium]